MNENQIINNILQALRQNEDIFDSSTLPLLYKRPKPVKVIQGGIEGFVFYFPFWIKPDTVNGYKLKHGKGYISISETYTMNNHRSFTKVAHVYKYITDEYAYECKSINHPSGLNKNINYNFHYDMDLNNPINSEYHAPTHLQVLHPHPRFPIEKISIELFITRVKVTCFKPDNTPFPDPVFLLSHTI